MISWMCNTQVDALESFTTLITYYQDVNDMLVVINTGRPTRSSSPITVITLTARPKLAYQQAHDGRFLLKEEIFKKNLLSILFA